VRLDSAGVESSAEVSDLAAVLAAAVTSDGRIDPAALLSQTSRLDKQLRVMAVSGPTATPELYPLEAARQAYWLNARGAWALKLAADIGCPERTNPQTMQARKFPLDGRIMSLNDIDQTLLQEAQTSGEFRLAACAPGVLVDYAPMPTSPFNAEGLTWRLKETFNRFVLDGRRFCLDVDSMEMRIPPMLWSCREMIVDQYQKHYGARGANLLTALGPHLDVRARQRLEEAVGYKIVPQRPRGELAIPKRRIFYPGKVGRIEP
jgi:hypothetical protein